MINGTDDISYLYTEQQRSAAFNAMVKETGWDNPLGFTADTFDYHFFLALQNDKLSFGGRQLWECYQKHLRKVKDA